MRGIRVFFLFAWRNLAQKPVRLVIACFGISFASFLMAFQISLLYGFSLAASRIVDAIDADIWIVGREIPAFDFISPIPRRIAWLARGAIGVEVAGVGIGGSVPFKKANGSLTTVYLVGVESSFNGRLPNVRAATLHEAGYVRPIAADVTDVDVLRDRATETRVQVNGRKADLVLVTSGLASFLGTPFAIADFRDAHALSQLPDNLASFVVIKVSPRHDSKAVAHVLEQRFPNYSVFTSREFSWRSRVFWLIKTGAGGALLLAAFLGFLLGLTVVAQTMYSATSEQIEDYATMRAIGGSKHMIFLIVAAQALVCGIVGAIFGLLLVAPAASLAKGVVTWITVPLLVYPGVFLMVMVLSLLAAMIACRPAINTDPARVFRA